MSKQVIYTGKVSLTTLKRKKRKLNILQIEVFFLLSMNPSDDDEHNISLDGNIHLVPGPSWELSCHVYIVIDYVSIVL